MQRQFVSALVILLVSFATRAGDLQLFHLAVSDVPVENGKVLNMEFQEVVRDDLTSSVQITRRSGGSVSSSMFVMRGMCGLARSRGKQNFLAKHVEGDPDRYIVTFPETAPERGKGFSISQCELMQF